ncbi:MAG: hypothetical protein J0L84_08490, partial [Verrucomicrobia bacterium]|nr:hypothetical protein [Verrucomicrobiota bacterium]
MSTATQGIDIVIGARTQQASAAMNLLHGFVQGIGMAVANFAGRAARALGEMTGQALHTADEMGKLGQKTGTTAEQISALAHAAKLSDVGLGELEVGIKGLSQWMEKNGIIGRDVIEVMLEQADALAGMADGAAKTNRAMDLFGRSGQQMIPLLNQGSEALREQMEEARRLGVVVSGETARGAEVFNDRMTVMKTALEGAFMQLAERLLPGLLELSDAMMATLENGGPFLDFLLEAGNLMGKAAQAAGWLAEKWQQSTTWLGSFAGSLAAGLSVQEAWDEASRDAAASQEAFRESVSRYRQAREDGTEGDRRATRETEALATSYDTLRMRLQQLQALAEGSTGERRAAGLRMQLDLLAQLEAQAGEATQMIADGGLLYTEEGLKAAERLLDIERARQQVMRELSAMTFSGRLQQNIEAMGTSMQRLADYTSSFVVGAMQGLSGALTDVIMGTKSAAQAFTQFGLSLLANFIASVLEMILIAKVAIPLLTYLGILSGGATAGTGLGVTMAALAAGTAASSAATAGFASGGLVLGPG